MAERRLTPIDRSQELRPLRRAYPVQHCALYWIPASFPQPEAQRVWLMTFLDLLVELATKKMSLRPEVFLQFKVIHPELLDPFLKNTIELNPLMGLTRRPGGKFPDLPTMKDVEEIQQGRRKFQLNDWVADYGYWFTDKSERRQRELFFGHGGLTMMFLKEDPKTKPGKIPFAAGLKKQPVFRELGVEKKFAQACAMQDGFLAKSKELFGAGLEDNPQFPGIPFIVPLLEVNDFMTQPAAAAEKWFQLFELYLNESPTDRGLVLAAKEDLDEDLIALLEQMRSQGLGYPER